VPYTKIVEVQNVDKQLRLISITILIHLQH